LWLLDRFRDLFPKCQRRAIDCTGLRILEVADKNLIAYGDLRQATNICDTIPSIKFALEHRYKLHLLNGDFNEYDNNTVIFDHLGGGEYKIKSEMGNQIIVLRPNHYKKFIKMT